MNYLTRVPLSRRVLWGIVCFLLFCGGGDGAWRAELRLSAADDTENLRLLEGMRQRRLYSLAADYCQRQLDRSELTQAERVDLTIQWMRILSEKGWHLSAEPREAVWEEARAVGRQFLDSAPEPPRRLLVELQEALLWRTEAEILRQEAEVDRSGERSIEPALSRLREAARQLEDIERSVREVALRPRTGSEQLEAFTEVELSSLGSHVRLHLARVYRIRAECYPPSSDDRLAGANEALQTLRDLLAQTDPDGALAWEGRIEQLISYRLAENVSESTRSRQAFRDAEIPRGVRARLHAEAARAALAESARSEALSWVEISALPSEAGAADLDLARLEVFVATWQALPTDNAPQQAEWRQRTVGLAKYIEQSHGRYWARRADQILLQKAQGSMQAGDVELLRRQADDLYLRGELAEALALYDEVAEAAKQGDLLDDAFRAGYRAGLVQVKRGEDRDALNRLRQVSREQPEQEAAPSAHLAAIQSAIRLARQDPDMMEEYEQLLREHVRRWPRGNFASRMYLWLGQLQRHQKRWPGAIEAYQRVRPTSPEGKRAFEGLEACWQGVLRDLQQGEAMNSEELAKTMDEAILSLRDFSIRTNDESSSSAAQPTVVSTSPLREQTALAAARLLLEFTPSRADEVEQLLSGMVVPANSGEAPSWQAEAETWLFLARALQPERQESARQLLQQLETSSPDNLWEVLERLENAAEQAGSSLRKPLGEFRLELLDRLESQEELDRHLLEQIPQRRARALVDAGDPDAARAIYRQLASARPRDGALQVEYARLLAESDDGQSLEAALRQWRWIAGRTPPHSDDWYAAKYAVAETLWKLQQPAEAAKLIRYLQVTSPLATTPWAATFEELQRRTGF